MYSTLYWEGDIVVTDKHFPAGNCFSFNRFAPVAGVAGRTAYFTFGRCSSSAVMLSCDVEYGLPPESVNSTRTCVGLLTVAADSPGPLTLHAYESKYFERGKRGKG